MRKVYVDTGRTKQKKEYEAFSVENSFVQTYIDMPELFFKLGSPCAMHLLIWVVSNMTEHNQIGLNKSNRAEFMSEARAMGKQYSDGTVRNAILNLRTANAIASMSDSGKRESQYMVNPSFFWKTKSQADRIDAIRGFRYQLKDKTDETN